MYGGDASKELAVIPRSRQRGSFRVETPQLLRSSQAFAGSVLVFVFRVEAVFDVLDCFTRLLEFLAQRFAWRLNEPTAS
jgi:hypothetical protein